MAHVLLIEPDALLAKTYVTALQHSGYEVELRATAQAAIMAADKHKPDMVILELQLVSHSGIEFMYEFRSYADWQSVPIVVLTHVSPGEFAGSRQLLRDDLGVTLYLYKPHTSLQKLLSGITELLPV